MNYPQILPSSPTLLTDPFGHPHPLMAAMDYPRILPSSPMLLTDPFGHPSPTDGSNGLSLDITKQSNAVDRPIWSPLAH